MTPRWAIGVDGGGTKTAALCRQIGLNAPLRRSDAGPCNIAAMDPADAFSSLNACLDKLGIAGDDVNSLCIGVAGYSAVERRETFKALLQGLCPYAQIELAPDYLIAHTGAFPDGIGIIVVAGTGSVTFGINPIGESLVTGGYGYLIDDAGTGYGLGRLILAAAGKSFDGGSGCELLTELFTRETGITTREELIAAVYGGRLDRVSIAALAPLVTQAADAGDSYAGSLLMHAGGALARAAVAAIEELFSASETVPVAKVGSLWRAGGELNAVFERSLLRACVSVKIIDAAASPVEGALVRACNQSARQC